MSTAFLQHSARRHYAEILVYNAYDATDSTSGHHLLFRITFRVHTATRLLLGNPCLLVTGVHMRESAAVRHLIRGPSLLHGVFTMTSRK